MKFRQELKTEEEENKWTELWWIMSRKEGKSELKIVREKQNQHRRRVLQAFARLAVIDVVFPSVFLFFWNLQKSFKTIVQIIDLQISIIDRFQSALTEVGNQNFFEMENQNSKSSKTKKVQKMEFGAYRHQTDSVLLFTFFQVLIKDFV